MLLYVNLTVVVISTIFLRPSHIYAFDNVMFLQVSYQEIVLNYYFSKLDKWREVFYIFFQFLFIFIERIL